MKEKSQNRWIKIIIAIVICAAIVSGIVYMFTKRPSVDIGKVTLSIESGDIELKGKEYISFYDGKIVSKNDIGDIVAMADDIQTITESPNFETGTDTSTTTDSETSKSQQSETDDKNTIKSVSDASVKYVGKCWDEIYYTCYKLDGTVIFENKTSLEIPTETEDNQKLEGCIMKIDVKWGLQQNYVETLYFFKCIYK